MNKQKAAKHRYLTAFCCLIDNIHFGAGYESEIRSRQEIGRGLRLCVNQNSERMDESVLGCEGAVMQVLSSIYDPRALRPENAHDNNVQAKVDEQKLHDREFTKLWQRINRKTLYTVSFDTQELIDRSVRGWTPT